MEDLETICVRQFVRDRFLKIMLNSDTKNADVITEKINKELLEEFTAIAKEEIENTMAQIDNALNNK